MPRPRSKLEPAEARRVAQARRQLTKARDQWVELLRELDARGVPHAAIARAVDIQPSAVTHAIRRAERDD